MPAPGGKDFLQAYNCQAVVDSAHHVILAVRATKVRAIYQQLSPAEVHGQLGRAVEQLREPFPQVAELLADAAPDILTFTAFPVAHWQKLWSNNPQERLNREIRRRRACSRKGTWWASSPTGRRRDGWWARCWPSSMTNGPKVSATSPSPPPASTQCAGISGPINIKRDDELLHVFVCCSSPVDRPSCGVDERGRVVHLWVSQATTLDCTSVKLASSRPVGR